MLLDNAQDLVQRHIPGPTAEQTERALLLGVKRNVELGWTQIQDAGGNYAEVELLRKLYGEGKIKLRVYRALSAPGTQAERLFKEGPILGEHEQRLTVRAVKLLCRRFAWFAQRRTARTITPTSRTLPAS